MFECIYPSRNGRAASLANWGATCLLSRLGNYIPSATFTHRSTVLNVLILCFKLYFVTGFISMTPPLCAPGFCSRVTQDRQLTLRTISLSGQVSTSSRTTVCLVLGQLSVSMLTQVSPSPRTRSKLKTQASASDSHGTTQSLETCTMYTVHSPVLHPSHTQSPVCLGHILNPATFD